MQRCLVAGFIFWSCYFFLANKNGKNIFWFFDFFFVLFFFFLFSTTQQQMVWSGRYPESAEMTHASSVLSDDGRGWPIMSTGDSRPEDVSVYNKYSGACFVFGVHGVAGCCCSWCFDFYHLGFWSGYVECMLLWLLLLFCLLEGWRKENNDRFESLDDSFYFVSVMYRTTLRPHSNNVFFVKWWWHHRWVRLPQR